MGYQEEVTRQISDGRFLGELKSLCYRTKDLSTEEKAMILELQAKLLREGRPL